MNKWEISLKKGYLGEKWVFDYLLAMGHSIYVNYGEGKSHHIDTIIIHAKTNELIAADVKTKPARSSYPDTGINIDHYGKYQAISKCNRVRLFLFFVDECRNCIYGQFLDVLDEPRTIKHNGGLLHYPMRDQSRIYWPLETMIKICNLSPEQSQELIRLNQSRFRIKNADSIQGGFEF